MGKTKRKPLTIEELKALKAGDWVWLVADKTKGYAYKLEPGLCSPEKEWLMLKTYYNFRRALTYANYGIKWVAYKNKEAAENADYCDVKQAQIEILQKLKEKLTDFANGDNEEEVLSKIEVCMDVENYIDKLIKELYGKGDQNQ